MKKLKNPTIFLGAFLIFFLVCDRFWGWQNTGLEWNMLFAGTMIWMAILLFLQGVMHVTWGQMKLSHRNLWQSVWMVCCVLTHIYIFLSRADPTDWLPSQIISQLSTCFLGFLAIHSVVLIGYLFISHHKSAYQKA